jgi:nitroreductase
VDLLEALYTTRAMRRVRPDPIPEEVQARILDAAIRAPSGGNAQPWRFVIVDSPEVKAELGPLYRDSVATLWRTFYRERLEQAAREPGRPSNAGILKVQRSAQWLADHYEEVPLYLFCFMRADAGGAGSIFPAAWSAQLAARGDGVGSSLTSVLGIFHPDEVRQILAVPEGWDNACMISFGYPLGRWAVAERLPVDKVAARNSWSGELGFSVPGPLWPSS